MRLGITGHRGLPPKTERLVRRALQEEVARHGPDLVGVSCIADGPDAWFAELVLEAGGRLEVVVPAENYRDGLPEEHHQSYDRLIQQAADVHRTGMVESDSQAHMAGSEILVGLVDELVAVWDGQPARGYGGTADVVAYAERTGVRFRVIWPEGSTRD
ncbi:hypothetical protein ACH4VS_00260 [Streptomyces hygroscopicus]|uniref:Uncharacterized protein n=1 Tax=Streptomyces hygroscopicus TaxID=1912 RepID=A0ABQ3TWC4_STRHY|nr:MULTISPECIES: hypothetical protein [Streptomyces]MDN3056740.1 hypothetical protein [Streptomyces sp. SRF1]GHJ27641.1 hypothetical protein TPA0910_20740 [Streptomyces hygroscopicus]GLV73231.1 hypothetical protein Shyhy02_12330 [Streptomyces hygroscopicus subsp. hygroscopicus]